MAQGDITASGTITANSTSSTAPAAGSTVTIGAADVATVGIQLTGTWVGTLIAEGNETGLSTDWVAAPMTTLAGAPTVGLTGNGITTVNAAPFMLFRLRSTAWTSGTANVLLHGAISGMGGGGSGGAGGASTIADGADVAQGSIADAAVQGDNAGTISAKLRGLNKSVAAGIPISSLPALPTGANVIGAVTQSGTWNVTVNAALPAGANAIGTVGVTALPALPTGANVIGAVTQSGTWNVTVNTALPTGSNVIGAVTQSGTWNVTVNAALPTGANTIGAVTQASGPWTVQGAAAAGAALAGNPVRVGISDGTNAQDLKQAVGSNATVAVAGVPVFEAVMYNQGSALAPFQASGTDAQSTAAALQVCAENYNGATLDKPRNNVDVTLLASASRTTTQGPTTLTTYNLGAIIFVLDMTTVGTGSVTLTINEVDPASGKSILLLSGAAVTTNSTNVYTIDPLLTAAANSIAKNRTTRTLSWTVTANSANPATYSLGAMELMP